MSQPDLTSQPRTVVVQKPKNNIYIVLLGVAALTLSVGCIFLLNEVGNYAEDAGQGGYFWEWFGVVTSA